MTTTFNRRNMPTTFQDILEAGIQGNRLHVKLCNNTEARWAGWDDECDQPVIVISLHGHDIVQIRQDGAVRVRDCGYVTTTTYDRLKRFLPNGYGATRAGGYGRVFDGVNEWIVNSMIWTRWFPA